MLREIPETRQIRGEPRRRWFNSAGMDLYVWYDPDGEPLGFDHYSHMAVDHTHGQSKHGGTPLLVPDGRFDSDSVLAAFARERIELPEDVAALVAQRIQDSPAERFKNV